MPTARPSIIARVPVFVSIPRAAARAVTRSDVPAKAVPGRASRLSSLPLLAIRPTEGRGRGEHLQKPPYVPASVPRAAPPWLRGLRHRRVLYGPLRELRPVQLRVPPVQGQQFVVRAAFQDLAGLDHEDQVVDDRGGCEQAVNIASGRIAAMRPHSTAIWAVTGRMRWP